MFGKEKLKTIDELVDDFCDNPNCYDIRRELDEFYADIYNFAFAVGVRSTLHKCSMECEKKQGKL